MRSTILVLAHIGNWIANVLYIAPVVIVVAMIAVSSWRDRRAERAETTDHPEGTP